MPTSDSPSMKLAPNVERFGIQKTYDRPLYASLRPRYELPGRADLVA